MLSYLPLHYQVRLSSSGSKYRVNPICFSHRLKGVILDRSAQRDLMDFEFIFFLRSGLIPNVRSWMVFISATVIIIVNFYIQT